MAITRSNSGLNVLSDAVRTYFHQKQEQMRTVLAKNNAYRATFNELSALNDRDLKDLGIRRSEIKNLTLEAVNGC